MMQKNLVAMCRIEPGTPASQSNAVPLYQWDSQYSRFFSRIYQKCRSASNPTDSWSSSHDTVGRLGHVLDDRLSVG